MTRITRMLMLSAFVIFPLHSVEAGDRTPRGVVLSSDFGSSWQLKLAKPTRTQQASAYGFKKKRRATNRQQRQIRATGIFALFNTDPQPASQRQLPTPRAAGSRKPSLARLQNPQQRNAQAAAYIQKTAAQRPLDPRYLPRVVNYDSSQKPGTIIIDTNQRHLYLIMSDGKARRYGVGVGKEGFEWSGTQNISRKAEWPSWRPPREMIERERAKGRELPAFMEGGPANPLGARALYLGDTLYRIHGTNQPWTIGQAVSSGCIRMRNEDVMDLYERTRVGAKVIVS